MSYRSPDPKDLFNLFNEATMPEVKLVVHADDLVCPHCGATELTLESKDKPITEWCFQIRAFKVADEKGHWWSHCTICNKWF